MKDNKISTSSIVDPMLEAGASTRAEIVAEVRRLRPDYKYPSAAVSNGFSRLVAAGKHPSTKDAGARRERKSGVPRPVPESRIKERMAKIDAWAARMDQEIGDFFDRVRAFDIARAKEPKPRRIWA